MPQRTGAGGMQETQRGDVVWLACDALSVSLDSELQEQGIRWVFAELMDPVTQRMVRYGVLESIDQREFFPTIEAGVTGFHQEGRTVRQKGLDENVAQTPDSGHTRDTSH